MSNPDPPRHVEVKDGDQTIAAAEVSTAEGAEGTARTSLHAPSGHTVPGSRASLVDAVMDQPEVRASRRLEATVPLGDAEALGRLRERTEDAVTRPAGSTALLDANLPAATSPDANLPATTSPDANLPATTSPDATSPDASEPEAGH